MHFIWWIEAKYKPNTHQELCYLNFDLTKWVQEFFLPKLLQRCYKVNTTFLSKFICLEHFFWVNLLFLVLFFEWIDFSFSLFWVKLLCWVVFFYFFISKSRWYFLQNKCIKIGKIWPWHQPIGGPHRWCTLCYISLPGWQRNIAQQCARVYESMTWIVFFLNCYIKNIPNRSQGTSNWLRIYWRTSSYAMHFFF